jgi:hypothetical protein
MSFLSNLWADLVDKRLWPVLIVLLLALVAVPLLLLKSGDSNEPSAPPIPSAAVPTANSSAISVDSTPERGAKLTGSSRNPFQGKGGSGNTQTHAASAPGPSTAGPGPSTGSTPSTGSSGAGTGSTGSPGSTGAGGGPTPVPSQGSSGGSSSHGGIVVRFGKAGSKSQVVDPLQALPSRKNPMVVYLGEKHGKAVFLISSDVTVGSNSDCKPSKDICQRTYVAPGTKIDVTSSYPKVHYVIRVSSAGS